MEISRKRRSIISCQVRHSPIVLLLTHWVNVRLSYIKRRDFVPINAIVQSEPSSTTMLHSSTPRNFGFPMSHSHYLICFEPFQSKIKKVALCDSVFQPMQYLPAMMTHCKTQRIVGEENRVVNANSPSLEFAQNFDLSYYIAKVPFSLGTYLRIPMYPRWNTIRMFLSNLKSNLFKTEVFEFSKILLSFTILP